MCRRTNGSCRQFSLSFSSPCMYVYVCVSVCLSVCLSACLLACLLFSYISLISCPGLCQSWALPAQDQTPRLDAPVSGFGAAPFGYSSFTDLPGTPRLEGSFPDLVTPRLEAFVSGSRSVSDFATLPRPGESWLFDSFSPSTFLNSTPVY